MKLKAWPLSPDGLTSKRGHYVIRSTRWGVVAQKWPKRQPSRPPPWRAYQYWEFGNASRIAANPNPIDAATALNLARGTQNVPRDLLTAAAMGTLYTIVMPDGETWQAERYVSNNIQLLLDQITNTVGAILYRDDAGWVALPPGNDGQVIGFADGLPTPLDILPYNVSEARVLGRASGAGAGAIQELTAAQLLTILNIKSGTWTPSFTCNTPGDLAITYTTQIGNWQRIGRFVLAGFDVRTSAFTHTTATGLLRIDGLPFTVSSDGISYAWFGALLVGDASSPTSTQYGPVAIGGTKYLNINRQRDNNIIVNLNMVEMPSGNTPQAFGLVAYQTDDA